MFGRTIESKEVITIAIAVTLSTALVLPFQKFIDAMTENQTWFAYWFWWSFSVVVWVVLVAAGVALLLKIFGYKVRS